MKHLFKLLFLLTFILPVASVSADTHDDATMDVIEHSDSDRYENEIELPGHDDDDAHDKNHDDDKNDEKDEKDDDKDDSNDEKDDDHSDDSSK